MITSVAGDQTDLPEEGGVGAANYCWTYTTHAPSADRLTAELWLRHIWEDGPKSVRVFLRLGWRFGLGLRLGPADSSHVLGWGIDATTNTTVAVSAKSPILRAQNTLIASGDLIRWQTDVYYENLMGRLIWRPASLLHQRIVPWSVRRSIRSQH
jgi:hypothetical protein